MGTAFMDGMRAICEELAARSGRSGFQRSRCTAIVPTLMLSGSNDPVTPARYGEQV